ncbi:MAG: hypothetical protein EBR60_11000 [Burkholderiaceae bacterium]|jgi:hypothetical protein|nr:hypothetical protein [Burkholderiaceae bacterium]
MPLGAVNAVSSTGGMSLSGAQHWNYQGKGCSKDDRARAKESNAQILLLELIFGSNVMACFSLRF